MWNWEDALDELMANEDAGMSARELEFVESLDGRRGRNLTDKQKDWLKAIWSRVFN